MKRYEKYKESGVDWIGEIPESWKIKKLKFLGKIYAGINGKKGEDFNKDYVEGFKTFVPFTNICNNTHIDLNQYQYVKIDESENQNRIKKDDILFLMSSETIEDIAKNSIYLGDDEELYLNSFCKGFRITDVNVHSQFINYLFLSRSYRNYFSLVGRGFTRINLKQEYINDVYTLLPTVSEQQAIAEFLDDKTAKIDQTIYLKEKEINLLKERRQILIQKAVTKGLNDQVKMKDSGVDWIGEIPEHWEVRKLKNIGQFINGYAFDSSEFKDEGIKVMKISNVQTMKTDWSDLSLVDSKYYDKLQKFRVLNGDLVFALTRPIISTGIKATIISENEKILLNQRNSILRAKARFDIKWLYFILLDKMFIQEFENEIDKTGQQPNISTYRIGNITVPFPNVSEINLIITYLGELEEIISKAISIKELEIEKLKEYKTVLIDNVVTGKVKVIA